MADSYITRDITIGGSITQQSVAAGSAKKYFTNLEAGYVYEVISAKLYADCTSYPSGGTNNPNVTIWYLANASGSTICSINGVGATATSVSQTGTSLGTPSATYKRIDCSSADSRIYLTHQSSGEGMGAGGLRRAVKLAT